MDAYAISLHVAGYRSSGVVGAHVHGGEGYFRMSSRCLDGLGGDAVFFKDLLVIEAFAAIETHFQAVAVVVRSAFRGSCFLYLSSQYVVFMVY